MTLEQLLASIGVNLASNAIYELAGKYLRGTPAPTTEGLRDAIASSLSVTNAKIVADRIVEFLARNGSISIAGSSISASNRITMVSFPGTTLSFGDGSSSRTSTTAIEAGLGARIVMQGGAKIVQNEDGSISFYV